MWYRYSREQDQEEEIFGYHSTSEENVPNIISEGLSINKPFSKKTEGANSVIDSLYPVRPVFLSLKPGVFQFENDATLRAGSLDPRNIVADIPRLIDMGAHLEEDEIWWEEYQEPEILKPYLVDGALSISELLTPGSAGSLAAIKASGTFAYLSGIHPSNISLV